MQRHTAHLVRPFSQLYAPPSYTRPQKCLERVQPRSQLYPIIVIVIVMVTSKMRVRKILLLLLWMVVTSAGEGEWQQVM